MTLYRNSGFKTYGAGDGGFFETRDDVLCADMKYSARLRNVRTAGVNHGSRSSQTVVANFG